MPHASSVHTIEPVLRVFEVSGHLNVAPVRRAAAVAKASTLWSVVPLLQLIYPLYEGVLPLAQFVRLTRSVVASESVAPCEKQNTAESVDTDAVWYAIICFVVCD